MQYTLNLESFLEHLRLRGIAVGVIELKNLQAVFCRSPQINRLELLNIFQTVLAKDDKERQTILYLFEQLVSWDDGQSVEVSYQKRTREIPVVSDVIYERRNNKESIVAKDEVLSSFLRLLINKVNYVVFYALVFLATLMLFYFFFEDVGVNSFGVNDNANVDIVKNSSSVMLLFSSILCFFILSVKTYKNIKLPKISNSHINKYGRSFLPPMKNFPKNNLLSVRSKKEISVGVEYYISESFSKKLDVDGTVNKTAKNGMPSVCFYRENRQKEVWLWQDQDSVSSNLFELADEIFVILSEVNVCVKRGYFHGIPSKVNNDFGEVFWSADYEYVENDALILILCDGNSFLSMSNTWDSEKDLTFYKLAQSNHLAIVDCGVQMKEVCNIVKRYSIECLLPEEISCWINKRKPEYIINSASIFDDLHLWAIACSLPSRVIMESEIRALHEVLQLNCIWHYSKLNFYAKETGMGLDFSKSRYELLRDFSGMAKINNQVFHKILNFWLKRNIDIDKQLCQKETLKRPWSNTRRQKQLELETALLKLWHLPEEGADEIYALFCIDLLKKDIENKISEYTCKDLVSFDSVDESLMGASTDKCENNFMRHIELPFIFDELPIKSQRQLVMSGFAGMREEGELLVDDFTRILFGIIIGLLFVSLCKAFL